MKVIIFYSGGKDSQACLIHSIKKYGVNNCEAVFCNTGWENPFTIEHIKETTNILGVKLVILESKKYKGMLDLAEKKKRFPSTKARFCTSELKTIPAIDYILTHKENLITIEGIRKSESFDRSKLNEVCTYFKYYFEPYGIDKKGNFKFHTYRKKDILKWCKKFNADKLRPIFNWNSDETINYILENGQKPNILYYKGFKRVGCYPCIMCNQSEFKLIIKNDYEIIKKIEAAEIKTNSSFFAPNYIPKRFCTGIDKNNIKYPKLKDVVKYLNENNATLDIFKEESNSCMSVYNLCE